MKLKTKRLLFLAGYVVLACLAVFIFKPTYLLSIGIVLVPPALVNYFWLKRSKTKILIFSLVSTFLFGFAIELATRLANVWDVQSVIPRMLGLIPIENMIFAFLNFFWVLSFYEYFVDKDTSAKMGKKFKYLVILFSIFSAIIFSLYFFNPSLITMDYSMAAVITLVIPASLIFYKHPKLLLKTIKPTLFFAFVFFVYESVSILIGSWWWPGEYLFPMNFFGHVFPLDDIIIWYFLSTIALIGGYEFFADDYK